MDLITAMEGTRFNSRGKFQISHSISHSIQSKQPILSHSSLWSYKATEMLFLLEKINCTSEAEIVSFVNFYDTSRTEHIQVNSCDG